MLLVAFLISSSEISISARSLTVDAFISTATALTLSSTAPATDDNALLNLNSMNTVMITTGNDNPNASILEPSCFILNSFSNCLNSFVHMIISNRV